jgi:tetratricopeptide (TPR) repeat protein
MRRINPLFLFACIAVGFLLTACVPPQPYHQERVEREEYKGPDYYFRDGMKDFQKGEYGEAIEDFQHVIQMQPNHVEAYFYMGQAYEQIGRREKAEKAYEIAISIDPRYVPAREALGLLEYGEKEYQKAEKQLEAARDLGSVNPNVFYVLGRIELAEKECRKAIQAFKEAIRLDPRFHEAREWLDKAEDRCGKPHHSKPPRTENSFKGGGKAIKPEDF